MRLRRGLAAAALGGASSLAAPAAAQHVEGRASLTAAASYNQTIADSPSATPLLAGPSLAVIPQGSLIYETPRTNNVLTYAFTLNVPFAGGDGIRVGPLSYGNRFAYSGRYELSELSFLTFACGLNHGPLQALSAAGDASQTQLDPVPAGAAYVLGVNAQQGFTRQLSPVLSLTQASAFSLMAPFDPVRAQARFVMVQNSLSLERSFARDSVGGQIAVATAHFTAGEGAGGVVIAPRTQVASTASASWSREITEALSSAVALGVTHVTTPGQRTAGVVQPMGTASLTYRLTPALMTLAYAHQAAPSLAAGSVSFTDTVTLRFITPIGRTGLLAMGSGGFARLTPIDAEATAATNVILGDASLAYYPSAVPMLSLGLRGLWQRQIGGPDATSGFTRLGASFNVTVSYPSARAAVPMPSMPPALGAAPFVPSTTTTTPEPIEAPAE